MHKFVYIKLTLVYTTVVGCSSWMSSFLFQQRY